ncbi:MAG: isochorismatase family protein [Lachnospiraceae bacterium]|nr:isochorismatase family protein [Lachnospiraceae bacterium]
MRYLLVVDMQEDYTGAKRNKKLYSYDTEKLINTINKRINEYPTESVIYITNKFFWEFGKGQKELVKGLNIVSNNFFEKKKKSAFSNDKLLEYLKKKNVNSLELVGVDGNYCVGYTALDGIRKGFQIICNESCIGVSDVEKFRNMKMRLSKELVQFI